MKQIEKELDKYIQHNSTLSFWWRDDDAEYCSNYLEPLLKLFHTYNKQLIIGVIPFSVEESVVKILKKYKNTAFIFQHGFSHKNYSLSCEKSEFVKEREISKVEYELKLGKTKLEQVFKCQFIPYLIPPWNTISDNIVNQLHNWGYNGISTWYLTPVNNQKLYQIKKRNFLKNK